MASGKQSRGTTGTPQLEASVGRWIGEASGVLSAIDKGAIARAIEALVAVQQAEGTIFTCGNGGSASTASHLALDLQKAARANQLRTRALCVSDSVGLITAWANDSAFEWVYAEQLDVLAKADDALVVISVSGSSPNLIRALAVARKKGLVTVGMLGKDGGSAAALCDAPVIVRSDDYGWVESAHVVLHHVLTNALRESATRGSLARSGGDPGQE